MEPQGFTIVQPRQGLTIVHISVITAIGAFSVSALSIFLGYKLFVLGATGAFQFAFESGQTKTSLISVAPGLGFAAFGMGIAIYALRRLIGTPPRPVPNHALQRTEAGGGVPPAPHA